MKEELKYELIESYLNGDLKGEALSDFERELQTDSGLKAEVELHRDIEIAMINKKDIPFIQTMNDIHQKAATTTSQQEVTKMPGTGKIAKRPILRYIAIAAVAAALLLAIFGRQFLMQDISPMQLSENTIGTTLTLSTARSDDGATVDQLLKEGYDKLDKGQYAEALALLEQVKTDTPDADAALGTGYANLYLAQYDKAVSIFQNISNNKPGVKDIADWYLAHTYLRQGKKEDCKILLQEIISSKTVTPKRENQARELLDAIR